MRLFWSSQTEEELITASPHCGKSHKPFLTSFLFYSRKKIPFHAKFWKFQVLKINLKERTRRKKEKFLNSESSCWAKSLWPTPTEENLQIKHLHFPRASGGTEYILFFKLGGEHRSFGFFCFQPSVYTWVPGLYRLLMCGRPGSLLWERTLHQALP